MFFSILPIKAHTTKGCIDKIEKRTPSTKTLKKLISLVKALKIPTSLFKALKIPIFLAKASTTKRLKRSNKKIENLC